MTTSTVAPEIAAFARGVREALSDLPAEDVDDLTEGLEADLAESLAEDLRRTLPDPVAYAAELRTAAGLPGRAPAGVRAGLGEVLRTAVHRLETVAERNPALAPVVALLDELRPAWWIVRAWVATWLLAAFFGMERSFGFEGAWWVVLLGLMVVSVQWGRGQWDFPGRRELVVVGNIVAALTLVPVFAAAMSWGGGAGFDDGYDAGVADAQVEPAAGLSLAGKPVTNLFAYDSAGQPLTGVQLFDQDGRPVDPFGTKDGDGRPCVDQSDMDCASLFVPSRLVTGKDVFNVFPLDAIAATIDDSGQDAPAPGAVPAPLPAPFAQVPAVQAPSAQTPEPVATPNQ